MMALLIQAHSENRPRVGSFSTVGLITLAMRLTRGTPVTHVLARMIVAELSHLAVEVMTALREGNAGVALGNVRAGAGLAMAGRTYLTFRVHPAVRRSMPTNSRTAGGVVNRENSGLGIGDVIARWEEQQQDHSVGVPPGMNLGA